jgi:bacterioferritin-associated ferredoxin
MEPVSIIGITSFGLQLSKKLLEIIARLPGAYTGNDTSHLQLTKLETRVRIFRNELKTAHDEFKSQEQSRSPFNSEDFVPVAALCNKCIEDCRKFLDEYENAVSASNSFKAHLKRAWLVTQRNSITRLHQEITQCSQHLTPYTQSRSHHALR